ncbi:MAG: UDP-N-acetylmuramate dehydrogenase, partial [Nitrospirae bacterium]
MKVSEQIGLLKEDGFAGEVMEDVLLRDYTSLRIGGPCEVMVSPKDPYSLKLLIEFLREHSIEYFVLGGGTNILVSDRGYNGVVITLRHWQRVETVETSKDQETLFVMAGTSLAMVVGYARDRGLTGLEGLVGIPGTVGGATVGNAGAFGYEFMDVVDRVTVVGPSGMEVIQKGDIEFGYRYAVLPGTVVAVHLVLRKADPQEIKTRMKEFLEKKKATQPLDTLSAGCVYKIAADATAGKLIEEAGLKGKRIGDIMVSEKHANFFINLGSGSAEDFVKLMELVRQEVMRQFSVELEPEIKL